MEKKRISLLLLLPFYHSTGSWDSSFISVVSNLAFPQPCWTYTSKHVFQKGSVHIHTGQRQAALNWKLHRAETE